MPLENVPAIEVQCGPSILENVIMMHSLLFLIFWILSLMSYFVFTCAYHVVVWCYFI